MPVHLYGLPADVGAMASVTAAQGVALVEDAAQALGATDRGRAVGSFGVGCFSLYATKNLTSGEGGVVTCDDDELADRLRLLRNQGMRARYEYEVPGHNYRLTDLQAAVAVPQLSRLGVITEQRRKNADALTAGLSDVVGVSCPTVPEERTHVWHQYTVRITHEASVDRDQVARALADRGVGTGIYYPRIVTDHACYRDHPQVRESDVPNARAAASEVLSLPVHPGLSDEDLVTIVDAVRGALGV
jgi:dTDP-4-amino-4,6-dideoxygalactose transaminase